MSLSKAGTEAAIVLKETGLLINLAPTPAIWF